jgi:hypothetical protein
MKLRLTSAGIGSVHTERTWVILLSESDLDERADWRLQFHIQLSTQERNQEEEG